MVSWWRRKQGRDLFRPLELLILDAISAQMPGPVSEVLQEQLSCTKMVQRLIRSQEVNIYCIRKRGQTATVRRSFDMDGQTQMLIAQVRLRDLRNATHLSCKVWIVDGRIFSLEFDGPADNFDGAWATVADVSIKIVPRLAQL